MSPRERSIYLLESNATSRSLVDEGFLKLYNKGNLDDEGICPTHEIPYKTNFVEEENKKQTHKVP